MRAEGITIDAVTVENEPLNPKNTPSMVVFAKEEETFIAHDLGPAFQKAGLRTKILLYDHNPDVLSYALSILRTPTPASMWTEPHFTFTAATQVCSHRCTRRIQTATCHLTEQSVTERRSDSPLRNCRTGATRDDRRDAQSGAAMSCCGIWLPTAMVRIPIMADAQGAPGQSPWTAILLLRMSLITSSSISRSLYLRDRCEWRRVRWSSWPPSPSLLLSTKSCWWFQTRGISRSPSR